METLYPESMIVMMVCERKYKSITIHSPSDSYSALKKFHNKRQEHFLVMTLNGAHGIIAIRIVSIGLVNRAIVHPRELFRPAIVDNAVAVILAHNHPSGRTDPSAEDRDITNRLIQAGELLGIEVLDHVIISKNGYYSFTEHGLIERKVNHFDNT